MNSSPKSVKTIYFAGDLFDHKHLIGNHLLAKAIEDQSDGRYVCILPQNHEQSSNRALEIRNNDFKMLLECDMFLGNFDGTDLDSGTVAEFMAAKFLDIPAVLLRTDFRAAGDGIKDGDMWNLMLSGYPRTETVYRNSMEDYQSKFLGKYGIQYLEPIQELYSTLADTLIDALNTAYYMTPVLYGFDSVVDSYVSFVETVGGGLSNLYPDLRKSMEEIVKAKYSKSIYA